MSTRPSAVLAVLLLAACEHPAPPEIGPQGPDSAFNSALPRRLTFNLLADRNPSWLPDGRTIVYSADRADRDDGDRCLALIPAAGGAIERYVCYRAGEADDSIDAFESAAAGAQGWLAFVHATGAIGVVGKPLAPFFRRLVRVRTDGTGDIEVLRSLPYRAPSDSMHQEVSHLAWLGSDSLIYVGARVAYARACASCLADTLQIGIEIAILDVSGATPAVTIVPGTSNASAVALGGRDTIYYTLKGDTRVLRRILSSGDTATVHDFGAAGIARDPAVRGTRLVAIVGGAVSYEVDPVLGPVQRDNGGVLHVVDLTTGADTVPVDPLVPYRRLALSPDGTQIVAEVVTGRTTDVWLVGLP